MTLKDVKYNAPEPEKTTDAGAAAGAPAPAAVARSGNENMEYGSWDLEFSTTGTYNNFLSFIRDIEQNLRIVDIASINFSSSTLALGGKTGAGGASDPALPETYKYDFKIKTYWLKSK